MVTVTATRRWSTPAPPRSAGPSRPRRSSSLPLVDRNVYSLLDLTPGVQSNNNGVAAASTGTSSLVLGYPEQRTLINGGADGGTGSVNYYLDGGINMTGLRNTGNILPNPDAIQEFKVQTNSYSVEYGRFASGVINVVTKSGTNQYHGSVFDFVRDGKFNAKDWGSALANAAARSQTVRRRRRRAPHEGQDLLLRLLFRAAAEHQHVPEHRRRADRAGARRRLHRVGDQAGRSGDRTDPSSATAWSA